MKVKSKLDGRKHNCIVCSVNGFSTVHLLTANTRPSGFYYLLPKKIFSEFQNCIKLQVLVKKVLKLTQVDTAFCKELNAILYEQ
jgi:hypothetical protein